MDTQERRVSTPILKQPKSKTMPIPFAALVPLITAAGQNVLQGINNRKARLYNTPANQVKRMREAGLPTAAGSNITGGQQVPTQVQSFGGEQFNDNLGKSITRQIDRKKLEIMQQELRAAQAAADLATGNARNMLNPSGQFDNTNQGISMAQAIGTQAEALKSAEMVNKYMPLEKSSALMKQAKETEQIVANTKNILMQNNIQVQDLAIKRILAKYQEDMSFQQLQSLIKENAGKDLRNEGMSVDNSIKRIAYAIEWQTMVARIQMAKNAALASGQSLEAGRLSLLLQNASLPSTQSYYEIRRGMDEATKAKPNLANTLLYLGMFQPTTSNYNFGQLMPSFPSGGNTYNTNNILKPQ